MAYANRLFNYISTTTPYSLCTSLKFHHTRHSQSCFADEKTACRDEISSPRPHSWQVGLHLGCSDVRVCSHWVRKVPSATEHHAELSQLCAGTPRCCYKTLILALLCNIGELFDSSGYIVCKMGIITVLTSVD